MAYWRAELELRGAELVVKLQNPGTARGLVSATANVMNARGMFHTECALDLRLEAGESTELVLSISDVLGLDLLGDEWVAQPVRRRWPSGRGAPGSPSHVNSAGTVKPTMKVRAADSSKRSTITHITVDDTEDEINSDGSCSLREAIQAANTDTAVDGCSAGSFADTIVVPAGVYTLSIAGADEDQNLTGDLDIRSDVELRGESWEDTIIDADGLDRVLELRCAPDPNSIFGDCLGQTSISVHGLTLRDGSAPAGVGGGLLIVGQKPSSLGYAAALVLLVSVTLRRRERRRAPGALRHGDKEHGSAWSRRCVRLRHRALRAAE